jgi:hypothetical protein
LLIRLDRSAAAAVVGSPLITQIACGRLMICVNRSSLTNRTTLSLKSLPE